jgi:flagellar L-ring protein precursor FlgH
VGDILTIVVTESATSTNAASSDVSKKTTLATQPGIGGLLAKIPAFSISGADDDAVSGTTSRSANLIANITVKVTKVLPNGNMEVEGTREVQTNKDKQMMTISGTVRQEDIATDNTIASTYVANAKIVNTGAGAINARMKPGLINKLLGILF